MLPNFIIIGAQKSGTTWLYKNLELHPEIWLPPEKELHFFDAPTLIPLYWFLFAPYTTASCWLWNRLVRDWNKVTRQGAPAWWYWRYYFFPRTWWWYRSLFNPQHRQVTGEATPRYALLSQQRIRRIHAKLPNLKIIYLMRDPIDRLWSDAAMFQSPRFGGQGGHPDQVEKMEAMLATPELIEQSRYHKNLTNWELAYGAENVCVGFYDQIESDPRSLLKKIFGFLGVDPLVEMPDELISRKVNQNQYPPMPSRLIHRAARELMEDVKLLDQRFQNEFTAAWLARASDACALCIS